MDAQGDANGATEVGHYDMDAFEAALAAAKATGFSVSYVGDEPGEGPARPDGAASVAPGA